MRHIQIVNTRNRLLSQHLQMSLNTRLTNRNNNVLIIGGSGAGKTFQWVKPNLMTTLSSSFIITDPKGEISRDTAGFLAQNGYQIKVLNLLNEKEMKKSTRYNPLRYIENDTDIVKMVTNFMTNTEKKNSVSGDQYWTDMAGMLLQSYLYYAWYEGVEIDGALHKDFRGVMRLANLAKVEENPNTGMRMDSELDLIFKQLELKNPEHPAVLAYHKATNGAADTVRSIISSLNSRLTCLQTPEIMELLSDDEMDIPTIGAQKTALYCVIPDNDKTYNFLVGMLYTQIFQQLYYYADFVYGGRLPIHVTFLLDEFANVALPDDFCSLLSTMRSREISSVIIIQSLAQLKKLFKETWEEIPSNCDTAIYLGSNEQGAHEYISKMLGKQTIYKKSSGQSKGRNGSTSINEDALGRELMLPEEVREIEGKKCIVLIRGYKPVIDEKIHTLEHPLYQQMIDSSQSYLFDARLERMKSGRRRENMAIDSEKNVGENNVGENNLAYEILNQAEVDQLRATDRLEEKEYETEMKISRETGSIEPDQPRKRVIELSYEELMELSREILGETAGEDFAFDKTEIAKNRESLKAEMENIQEEMALDIESAEKLQKSEEDQKEIQKNTTKPEKEYEESELARLFLQLRRSGYDSFQIKSMLNLIKSGVCGKEEAVDLVHQGMDQSTVREITGYFNE